MESIHLKGLNGVRAIAAFGVVLFHVRTCYGYFELPVPSVFEFGTFCVTIFFTLSGFLITYLLLNEKETGSISVKKFYARRILRIWPLYYSYMALAVLSILLFDRHALPGSIGYYIFFAPNIPMVFDTTLPYLIHYWSLGVEEQFYIFYPLIVKRSKHLGRTIGIFSLLIIGVRIFLFAIKPEGEPTLALSFLLFNRFDCIAIGCLGAIAYFQKTKIMNVIYSKSVQLISWTAIVLFAFGMYTIPTAISHQVISIFTIIIILNVSTNTATIISLENKFFDFFGRISYGMYVIHPLVIIYLSKIYAKIIFPSDKLKIASLYVLIPSLTVLSAYLSYELLEKRFIRMKKQYTIVSNSAEVRN